VPGESGSVEPRRCGAAFYDAGDAPTGEPAEQAAVAVDAAEDRPVGNTGVGEPGFDRTDRARRPARAVRDGDNVALAALVSFRTPDRDRDAAAAESEVGDVEGDELGAAEGAGEADKHEGAIAQPEQAGWGRCQERAQLSWGNGGLARGGCADGPEYAFEYVPDCRVSPVDLRLRQAMLPADGSEAPLERGGRERVGTVGEEKADDLGRGGKGGKPMAAAPGVEIGPVARIGAAARRRRRVAGVFGGTACEAGKRAWLNRWQGNAHRRAPRRTA
jgi:hypothetical protein